MKSFKFFSVISILFLLSACDEKTELQVDAIGQADSLVEELTVYKSLTCGCCKKWIAHIEGEGVEVKTRNVADLNAIKTKYQIAPQYQSCHTAVSRQGYVFEGHVPARFIKQFLENPPANAIGLSVPGMPLGSPGMEMGEKFMAYQVLLLKKDGSTDVFVQVNDAAQQFSEILQP